MGGYEKFRESSRKKKRVPTLFIFEMIREISSNLPTKTQVSLQYRDFCGEENYLIDLKWSIWCVIFLKTISEVTANNLVM